ncbi:mycofactocin system GMC family oxidoreductase MftG [Gordonia sp. ABSL11-1]|uniref:mycofactocin system GMC family oxidoreductase MftG n=1 Tax=Gordonia sp. ABSL11-1 TaxID=3053924 RepID=UPI0025745E19|nr:mycofactocin system GMC family oxidoreductase MftG [Gordonia sp. ABSL11-1]MDL9944860.1 mycofactocin system GMC family oxidoreductase MftG [Gordonia sp. ABSL11-1]
MSRDDLPSRVDVIVVGAGSAGCVIAERLSRNPDRSVLLLDRGPHEWPTTQIRDLGVLPISAGSPYAQAYDEASGLGVIRGRGLGGSSSVNGGYFLRWHPGDFDDWPTGWTADDVAAAYAELDAPGGTMGVSAFADDELADVVPRFEAYWARSMPIRRADDPWPIVGVNRVRSNREGDGRRTAAEAYLRAALGRQNLVVATVAEVTAVTSVGRTVTGVDVGGITIDCGEVVLSAGTLGTAAILLRSGLDMLGDADELPVHEHREVLVHYRARWGSGRAATRPLLQSVVHTADDIEIRCYSDDMANYIKGLPPAGPAMGVAVMRPGTPGSVRLNRTGLTIDLGTVDDVAATRFEHGVGAVAEMLRSDLFAGDVNPDSVAADPVVRTSQHAWGSMPMGERTDWLGGVIGVHGLRVVDGSILPTAGRSGPHATIMMTACRIGDRLLER